jgi:hypothetical protein
MPQPREEWQVSPFVYLHSEPLSPEAYENADLPTRFRSRISKHSDITVKASWDCRDDVPRPVDNVGCICPLGQYATMAYPESSQERICMITYNFEYAFVHDGKLDPTLLHETISKCCL